MNASNGSGAPGHWHTTVHEAREWGRRHFHQARETFQTTSSYFPRYIHRDTGPDGLPVETDVQVASLVATLPGRTSHLLLHQARRALGDQVADPRIRFLPKEIVHVTHHAIFPGRNAAEDAVRLDVARAIAPAVREIVKTFPAMQLTLDGFTLSDKQLMATYSGNDGWNRFMETVARLEQALPAFANAYDVSRSPLQERGRALQTTVAVFDKGLDMGDLAKRIEPYLAGHGAFEPIAFPVRHLSFVVQEFDQRYIQRFAEVLSHAPLFGVDPLAHSSGLPTPDLGLGRELA